MLSKNQNKIKTTEIIQSLDNKGHKKVPQEEANTIQKLFEKKNETE